MNEQFCLVVQSVWSQDLGFKETPCSESIVNESCLGILVLWSQTCFIVSVPNVWSCVFKLEISWAALPYKKYSVSQWDIHCGFALISIDYLKDTLKFQLSHFRIWALQKTPWCDALRMRAVCVCPTDGRKELGHPGWVALLPGAEHPQQALQTQQGHTATLLLLPSILHCTRDVGVPPHQDTGGGGGINQLRSQRIWPVDVIENLTKRCHRESY